MGGLLAAGSLQAMDRAAAVPPDSAALFAAACADQKPLQELAIPARQRALHDGRGTLEVTCRPYARHAGHPVSEVRECRRDAQGAWGCEAGASALWLRHRDTELRVSWRHGAVTPSAALEVATLLARDYTQTFNGQDLSALLAGTCTLADGGPGPFRGSRQLVLRCARGTLTLTRDCWQGRCRLFPAEIDLPAAAQPNTKPR